MAHLRALLKAASPGPWEARGEALFVAGLPCGLMLRPEDAAFVAVARDWLADVLDEYGRLKAREGG